MEILKFLKDLLAANPWYPVFDTIFLHRMKYFENFLTT